MKAAHDPLAAEKGRQLFDASIHLVLKAAVEAVIVAVDRARRAAAAQREPGLDQGRPHALACGDDGGNGPARAPAHDQDVAHDLGALDD